MKRKLKTGFTTGTAAAALFMKAALVTEDDKNIGG